MYGAAAGDIYWGIMQSKEKQDAEQGTEQTEPKYSGCTILTAATVEALLKTGAKVPAAQITQTVAESLRAWGNRHPEAQYSEKFTNWLLDSEETPGDVLDMSPIGFVSAAGWLYSSLERTEEVAKAVAQAYTSNEEVIRAAQCVADLIFLSRTGRTKAELLAFAQVRFGYDISPFTRVLQNDESIDGSGQTRLPVALAAFGQSTTLTQAMRNLTHLGANRNDAAAVGSLLEATDGLDASNLSLISKFLPEDCARMMADISQFEGADRPLPEDREKVEDLLAQFVGLDPKNAASEDDELSLQNEAIQKAIEGLYAAGSTQDERVKAEDTLESALLYSLRSDGQILVAWNVVFANPKQMDEDAKAFFSNGMVRFYEGIRADIRVQPRTTAVALDEKPAMALFTNPEELRRTQSVELPLRTALHLALNMPEVNGIIFNPFGHSVALDRQTVLSLLEKSGEDVSSFLTAPNRPSAVSPSEKGGEDSSFRLRMLPSPNDAIPWNPADSYKNADIETAARMTPIMSSRFQVLREAVKDTFPPLERTLMDGALQDTRLLMAYKAEVWDADEVSKIAQDELTQGATNASETWVRIMPVAVSGADGTPHTAVFTQPSQADEWKNTYRFLVLSVEEALHLIQNLDENVGLAINPFSANAHLDRNTVTFLLQDIRRAKHIQSEQDR